MDRATIAILAGLILLILMQKYLVEGLSLTGLVGR